MMVTGFRSVGSADFRPLVGDRALLLVELTWSASRSQEAKRQKSEDQSHGILFQRTLPTISPQLLQGPPTCTINSGSHTVTGPLGVPEAQTTACQSLINSLYFFDNIDDSLF